ncbi:hypothetical protein IGI04_029776 [Brassica rapa subsp. trilocularis]|uniref:Uncharacterized protein n=1 Tax=Brassica rapa subsp. trilocularis TaxID=1813537 RepID=A0ABQ7LQG5_BRACM|nr:hypothetical protein IGI04_029776 [Brassica rapa subsp. trilocularis]
MPLSPRDVRRVGEKLRVGVIFRSANKRYYSDIAFQLTSFRATGFFRLLCQVQTDRSKSPWKHLWIWRRSFYSSRYPFVFEFIFGILLQLRLVTCANSCIDILSGFPEKRNQVLYFFHVEDSDNHELAETS